VRKESPMVGVVLQDQKEEEENGVEREVGDVRLEEGGN